MKGKDGDGSYVTPEVEDSGSKKFDSISSLATIFLNQELIRERKGARGGPEYCIFLEGTIFMSVELV